MEDIKFAEKRVKELLEYYWHTNQRSDISADRRQEIRESTQSLIDYWYKKVKELKNTDTDSTRKFKKIGIVGHGMSHSIHTILAEAKKHELPMVVVDEMGSLSESIIRKTEELVIPFHKRPEIDLYSLGSISQEEAIKKCKKRGRHDYIRSEVSDGNRITVIHTCACGKQL